MSNHCRRCTRRPSTHPDHQSDGVRQPFPLRQLLFELRAAGACQRVELGFAAGIGAAPLGAQPALLFEPVERGIESALCDLKHVFADLLDAAGDGPSMHGFERKRAEDEEVERALNQVGWFAHT